MSFQRNTKSAIIKKFFKHITHAVAILFGVVTLIFFLFNVLPGDPAQMMLDQHENEEQVQKIRARYGFDLPLEEQYIFWLNDLSPISIHGTKEIAKIHYLSEDKYSYASLIEGDSWSLVLKWPYLRKSFQKQDAKVADLLMGKILNTFVLAMVAIVIAFILGIVFGLILTVYKSAWVQFLLEGISILGMAVPSFFASVVIAWFFGFYLKDVFSFSMTGSLFEVDDLGRGEYIAWKNLVLPAITLGIRPLAVITQLTKASLESVLEEDYIRTARAKGLSEFRVLIVHGLRNALNPVITASSGWFASMLAGAVFIEYIFAWDGIGKLMVESLEQMDLPVVMGIVLFISFIFVLINIFVDQIYSWLDPRIRNRA